MSQPRPVFPESIVMVTRRCSERRFFLRPDRKLVRLIEYLLAVGSELHCIELIHVCVMSNHWHAVLHDPKGVLPRFLQWFHAMVAKSVNAKRGRTDHFWDNRQTNVCALPDGDSVIDKSAYVLANPVAARIVRRGSDWSGFRTTPFVAAMKPRRVQRPRGFFSRDGAMPRSALLRFYVPPSHAHLSSREFGNLVRERTERLESRHREVARERSEGFSGLRCLPPWNSAPTSLSPRPIFAPLVAGRRRGVVGAYLQRLAAFRSSYRVARTALLSGTSSVCFPVGTWLIPRLVGPVRAPPPVP
jgi:putative transposase